jgi:hypothetical protein
MPEFQRKQNRFKHTGIQWNMPGDAIPDGQVAYARNVRVTQQGTVTQRPGLTSFASLGGQYTHSIARLNNFNTALVNFSYVYLVGQGNLLGGNGKLFVGQTSSELTTGAINPIKLPGLGSAAPATNTLSGNPLTMVDMAPRETQVGWKYIGDTTQNISVGYYPGDDPTMMARALTMGMTPPVNTAIPATAGAGLLIGDYQWIFAYRNMFTGARSNPSQPTRVTQAAPALTCATNAASFTLPVTPKDPQTNAADAHILIDIYRFGGTIFDWRYVGTGASGTSFTDNLPDASIETAATPPEITDPVTGVTRFNLFRPFIVQSNATYSTTNGTAAVAGTGKWTITAGGADVFNLNWLPGSVISINNRAWTIFQVQSTAVIEIVENATGSLVNATGYPWATATGTLTAGGAVSHIWGPYGTGSGGAFVFGCGGTVADAGTLYWCNGNDPDSTDLPNSLIVTSPSEPLRGGCIYDGTPFCWSTERMFRIYPGATAGQFTVQEIPGSKGLWAEYSLTVQSNGISDQSISWVGKDGVYDWSASAGLLNITDRDLYPFFPHDNQPGLPLSSLQPFITEPIPIFPPDLAGDNLKFHRLTWYQDELFYDFPSGGGVYNTLLYDPTGERGFTSLDQYAGTSSALCSSPLCRGIEIAASNLKVGIAGEVLDYTGLTDAGHSISCRLVTRQDDMGGARVQKLYGDYMIDAAAGNATLTFTPLTALGYTPITAQTFTNSARTQNIYPSSPNGLGVLSATFGLDVTWTASSTLPTLYQWEYAYVPKPEFTTYRATDKTDDGYNGAKFLQGLVIECDTAGVSRSVNLVVDGNIVKELTVYANGQIELPFGIVPVIGSEFQLQPTDASQWQLYQVRWVWEPVPELVTNYTTQPTNHDLPGYHYLFDGYIAYQGGGTLTITTEYGSLSYALPSSGSFARTYILLAPQKAKWRSYAITGNLRLYAKDSEIRAKNWTDKGNYPSAFTSFHPFGEMSRASGARI